MSDHGTGVKDPAPRLIAFYLPQFHPVPENDAWWGPGFTEWTNVVRTAPRFDGHYQPHLPADLGFTDLRLPEVRQAQADMARRHGIHGFCYYHYWFKGRRVLDRPFSEVLESGAPDFPFCLCWANDNWTRAWDAGNREILIPQEHDEADDVEHIRWLSEAFRDPRYITVDGRPLLLVYRPQLLPNARSTFETWRKHCADAGLPEPYICKFETYGDFGDPARIGCDASAEFLPHGVPENMPPPVAPPGCHPDDTVFDYAEVAAAFASRQPVPWRRYSCVLPGWDNSPRQLDSSAFLLHGADPAVYRRWLTGTVDRSLAEGRDIVFVNAWNEWAEGAHLEPDQRFGRAFLEATRQALEDSGYGPAFSGPASTMGTTADAHPGADRPAPASLARSYEDLSERFVRLQRTQTEQYGALRRATDRELERLTAELEAARCDARTIARWAQRLEADLSLRRDGETGLPRGATVARDAAAAPAAAARHSGPPTATRRYLDLLKGCLTRLLFVDEEAAYTKHPGGTRSLLRLREHGRDWPATAETMIGMARLDNVEWCVTEALRDGVGGDLLEAGVWRGGASILMRAVLAAYGDTTRTVWLADSFRGLPPPDRTRFPDEMAEDLSVFPQLAVSLRTVEDNFARYGLLDDQVRVLPGYFADTLPTAPVDRLAVLRLDGDYYQSTIESLEALYPKVSPGGFVIVDDYLAIEACRRAVDDYREVNGIDEAIEAVDWAAAFWRKRP